MAKVKYRRVKLSKDAEAMLKDIRDLDGIEVPRPQWYLANELHKAGEAKYRRPWAIMEGSVDVAPTGARIIHKGSWDNDYRYVDEDYSCWMASQLMEMDADAAAMRRAMTKNDHDDDVVACIPLKE